MSTEENHPKLISTPQTVLENFILTWSPEVVKDHLWNIFRFAIMGKLEGSNDITVEEVTRLFDHINELVEALHALPQGSHWSIHPPQEGSHA